MVSMSVFIVFCIVAFLLGGLVGFGLLCCLLMANKDDLKPIKEKGIAEVFYKCPYCKNVVEFHDRFCSECGQGIDWSDVYESPV